MARHSPYRLLPETGASADSGMFPQKEALKDSVDLSKNLVGGDLERVYKKPAMEKSSRKTLFVCQCVVFVAVAGLAAWLLGLTLVRERELSRMEMDMRVMRSQIEILNTFTDKMKTEMDALKKQVEADKNLVNDLHSFEDGIYADVDHNSEVVEDSFGRGPEKARSAAAAGDRVSQLDSITTVLEDDEDFGDDDDDDNYEEDGEDGEDGESGDWYLDYDKRRENKVGTSGMTRLTPEDLLGKVLNARPVNVPDRTSKVHELRRILHQNADVSLAGEEPKASPEQRLRRSVPVASPDDTLEFVDAFAAPRLYRPEGDERRKAMGTGRKTKKYISPAVRSDRHDVPAADLPRPMVAQPQAPSVPLVARHDLPRHTRNSDDEDSSTSGSFVAAHFHGDTSHLSMEIHEHYKGNGLVRLPHDAVHQVWAPSAWTSRRPTLGPTLTRAGHVLVNRTGIYFVYVQIFYLDVQDVIGWVLHRSSASPGGAEREPLLQCAGTIPPLELPEAGRGEKANSCYSAAALLLNKGDLLAVRNTGGGRHSVMQHEKSFIGLIKLADAEEPVNDY